MILKKNYMIKKTKEQNNVTEQSGESLPQNVIEQSSSIDNEILRVKNILKNRYLPSARAFTVFTYSPSYCSIFNDEKKTKFKKIEIVILFYPYDEYFLLIFSSLNILQ